MTVNLPTDLLRNFSVIVETGSMLRATEQVLVTQSALSLQMKRLEETVQSQLFYRNGRKLTLSPAGRTLLAFAHELLAVNDRAVGALTGDMLAGPARVGLVQDFAESLLTGALSQFSKLNGETELQVRVGGTAELLELLSSKRLDIVLGMGLEDDPNAIKMAPMVWLGNPALDKLDILPIAVLEAPCRFRDAALTALDAAKRPYRIAVETPSLSVLRAAIDSDLCITCRTDIVLKRAINPADAPGLPNLPMVSYTRHTRPAVHAILSRLSTILGDALAGF